MASTQLVTFSEMLARQYVRLFKRYPGPTAIATVVILGVGSTVAYFVDADQRLKEKQRIEAVGYTDQLRQLDTVQQSIKNLSEFISQQRTRLQESEQVVTSLQAEKKRIEPLVQADRKAIEAVFQLQEQRSAASVRSERWIGFGFGVAASLLASFIYALIVFFWRRTRNSHEPANI
jgi:uncharacterized protein HemX